MDSAGNVGIGTTSPSGKLHIAGTADDQQLIVQANSSQTANILEIQNSSNDVLSGVDERGILFSDGGVTPSNLFVGRDAGLVTATGTVNVGIGTQALKTLTTGTSNVGIGYLAGTALTEGSYNVLFGREAGELLSIGASNIFLGFNSGGKQKENPS